MVVCCHSYQKWCSSTQHTTLPKFCPFTNRNTYVWVNFSTDHTQLQGCRKQSPDGQAQVDVGGESVNNSHEKRAAKIWTLVFLAVRRRSNCTSASNWDSKAWKLSHTERKCYACALRYVPAKFYYSNLRTHKCRSCIKYVSTSAENDPAMAGPAGPVLAPMSYCALANMYIWELGLIPACQSECLPWTGLGTHRQARSSRARPSSVGKGSICFISSSAVSRWLFLCKAERHQQYHL